MMNTITQKIEKDAKAWLLRIHSGKASDNEFMAFEQWLAENDSHKAEYQRLETMWHEMDDVKDEVLEKYGEELQKERRLSYSLSDFFRQLFPSPLTFSMALSIIVVGFILYFSKTGTEHYDTQGNPVAGSSTEVFSSDTGQIVPIELSDNSTIELGPESRVEVAFTSSARKIRLLWGEAYFSVAKDSSRPFVVTSGNGSVRALGTEFEIHKGVRETSVTVHEGLVEVSTVSAKTRQPVASESLGASQQVSYTTSGPISPVSNVDLSMRSGWRNGRIIFNNQALIEVVADLNRYSKDHIVLADERLFDIEVNGVFKMGEFEAVINAIENALPAKAIRNNTGKITLVYVESH